MNEPGHQRYKQVPVESVYKSILVLDEKIGASPLKKP
jgi:hypothetical protein